jgi:hypothetical protein
VGWNSSLECISPCLAYIPPFLFPAWIIFPVYRPYEWLSLRWNLAHRGPCQSWGRTEGLASFHLLHSKSIFCVYLCELCFPFLNSGSFDTGFYFLIQIK